MGRGDSARGGGAGAAGDREPTAAAAGPACLATVSTSLPVRRVEKERGGAGRPAGGARWRSFVPARPEAVRRPPRLSHGLLCGQMAPPARLRPSAEHWKG